MPFHFGDVVLVPFPFTDLTATKRRPAVVVSSDAYHHERVDLILMAISSQVRAAPVIGEIAVQHWQATGLLKPSVIKPLLATIEIRIVLRLLGQLDSDDQKSLRQVLGAVLG